MDEILCGLDEAGRGPLAGPVVAGAVILPDDFPIEILNDSKKLSEKKRLLAEPVILEKAVAYGIGEVSHTEIDRINILNASLLAMKRAFEAMLKMLEEKTQAGMEAASDGEKAVRFEWRMPEVRSELFEELTVPEGIVTFKGGERKLAAIADGIYIPEISVPCRAEVKADGRFPCVMAASILAKNHRDRIMCDYAKLYPEYGYERHKGYPCPAHKEVCRRLGPSPIQRMSFKYQD